jgi:four helix bundle protein
LFADCPIEKRRMGMRDFRTLKVWEKAHEFTLQVYGVTRSFPADERFGLTAQIRRAAASVPSNIAEGCGRATEKELARFMSIAAGSASEAEYQLLLACDLDYLKREKYSELNIRINEVKMMLNSFIQKLTANG